MALDLTQILFKSEKEGFVNARTTAPVTATRLSEVISINSGFPTHSSIESARYACMDRLPDLLRPYEANAFEEVGGHSHDSRQECDPTPFSYSLQVIGYRI